MTYLGVDIGTSGVKAILIDRAGRALGEATARSVEPVRPHPGWSEQNPADWWTAVLAALDALSKSHPAEMAAVRGIGLSGHMHGATLIGDQRLTRQRPSEEPDRLLDLAEAAFAQAALVQRVTDPVQLRGPEPVNRPAMVAGPSGLQPGLTPRASASAALT